MKQNESGVDQKDTQIGFRPFRSPEADANPQIDKKGISSDSVTKKDLFLMSFFAFITGGVLILGVLFFTGAITGNVELDFPGGNEVTLEETTTPVIETPESTEEVTETLVETPVVEEVVLEEPVAEVSDPCGSENEIVLYLDEIYEHNGRQVILKLAGEFSAQISVGGKKELISVGESVEINGMPITMVDGDEAAATATITIACE